jgi:L-fuculose-phosphate aldolase
MTVARDLFDAVLAERVIPQDPRIPELIAWAARFASLGWTPSYGPGDHGNLSCRTPQGLLISARATVKARLHPEQFTEVLGVIRDGPRVEVRCRGIHLPSTDTRLHLELYARRPDIQAILHGHDARTLAKAAELGLPVTAHSASMPSLELIDDACKLVERSDYIILRDHGFLTLGPSIQAAGEQALRHADDPSSTPR